MHVSHLRLVPDTGSTNWDWLTNTMLRHSLNFLLRPLGHKIVPSHFDEMIYQHDYGSAGYDRYRKVQVFHNHKKIDQVWADEQTLGVVADYVRRNVEVPVSGLCHGVRNGFEQSVLAKELGIPVIGTDISDTAPNFPDTVQWDFHDVREDWVGQYSFVYSNSLDQAFDPAKALRSWVDQVDPQKGLVLIEHTLGHSAQGASEMDPFGAHPLAMPYLIFEWGRGHYHLHDIVVPPEGKANNGLKVWLFVIAPDTRPRLGS